MIISSQVAEQVAEWQALTDSVPDIPFIPVKQERCYCTAQGLCVAHAEIVWGVMLQGTRLMESMVTEVLRLRAALEAIQVAVPEGAYRDITIQPERLVWGIAQDALCGVPVQGVTP